MKYLSCFIAVLFLLGISAMADNQQTVYVRWSYTVISDRAFPNSGWNIDDVELWGTP